MKKRLTITLKKKCRSKSWSPSCQGESWLTSMGSGFSIQSMEYLSLPDFLLQHGFIAPSELNIDVSFVSGKIYYFLGQKKKKILLCWATYYFQICSKQVKNQILIGGKNKHLVYEQLVSENQLPKFCSIKSGEEQDIFFPNIRKMGGPQKLPSHPNNTSRSRNFKGQGL